MTFPINFFGLSTHEVLTLDQGRGDCGRNWNIEDFAGPTILLNILKPQLGFAPSYLYPEHLKLLYSRFREANPAGARIGLGDRFFDEGLMQDVKEDGAEDESESFFN